MLFVYLTCNLRPRTQKKRIKNACKFLNLWYTTLMINRKDQIHATLYNAAIDGGFMLYAGHNGVQDKVMVKDLLEDTPDFEVTFTGKDISDVDVEIDNGVRMGA